MPEQHSTANPEKGEIPYHIPVMLQEAIDGLDIKPDGVYVDCTFGGGGHGRAILQRLTEKGKLIAFDQDEDAGRNLPNDPRLIFVPHNFRHIGRFLKLYKAEKVDGILADLGVSSHQFDEAARGFSTRFDAPLDMRMDSRQPLTAAAVLQDLSELELHKIFERYGEVTNAKTLARTITEYRQSVPLKTIRQFKDALQSVVKGNPNKYFAQVFQALRIVVNDEFGALEEMLELAPSLLKPGGRISVITFHSLEDRIVKNFFRYGNMELPEADEVYGTRVDNPLLIINKKPIVPSIEEVKRNPRARSAKLRIAQRK
ncbi:MAG: 16S rRNA (cytosine(1402)-N(4))-methyltransferase RsmH [Chitinophagaceae bacterium]